MWQKGFKFCGLCSIKVGIIFYFVINLASNLLSLFLFWITISNAITAEGGAAASNSTASDNEEEFNERMRPMLWSFVAGVCIFIIVEGFFIGLLVHGIRKSKPRFVRIHMIYGLIMWLFGVMMGFTTILVLGISNSVLRVIMTACHGFMLLNLRILFKKMMKSQVVTILSPDTSSTTALDANSTNESSQGRTSPTQHCRTCSCNQPPALRNGISGHEPITLSANRVTDPLDNYIRNPCSSAIEEGTSDGCSKQLNFKDEAIIYDTEQLERNPMHAVSTVSPVNENCSDNTEKNEIFLEKGVPVIYDENQLNLGRSNTRENFL